MAKISIMSKMLLGLYWCNILDSPASVPGFLSMNLSLVISFVHWLLFQRFTIFLLMFAGISPTTIYARVGDEASFNCSHTSNILPTSFRLNELTYRPLSTLPGYIHNTYIMGVLTVFFTRTNIFSEPSLVSCVYSQCQTGPATIRNPGTYVHATNTCWLLLSLSCVTVVLPT